MKAQWKSYALTAVASICLATFSPNPVYADTTYTYTGNPFTSLSGSFSCPPVCNIAGSFTVSQPLGPNLTNFVFTPTSYSFSNGYQTFTIANSFAVNNINFNGLSITTDSAGVIVGWYFSLLAYPPGGSPTGTVSPGAQIFTCGGLGTLGCGMQNDAAGLFSSTSLLAVATNTNQPGSWSSATTTPVPEPGTLFLFGTGLAGLVARRRQP